MALKKIGKYIVIDKIAKGGMGTVYKAKHPTLNRTVIIKQLSLKGVKSISERFKREARIMFKFRNEHIVQVYDHFREGSSFYMVMEFIDGIDLDKLIKRKRYLPIDAAAVILSEVCKGLKYAHDNNVIHRDIKPANILISKAGEIKLTDFGIATSEDETENGLTKRGTTLGTPAYMSPEQIADTKNVDKRADIFSIGVLFYQMVTGKLPFAANMSLETLAMIQKGKYKSPRKINPKVSRKIQVIIKKLMHHKRNSRYKDLKVVISKLKPYLRRYKGQEQINRAIKEYAFGSDDSQFNKGIAKRGLFKIGLREFFLKGLFALGVFAVLAGFFYYNGYFFELFKRKDYGVVKLVVKTQKRYKNFGKSHIKASFSKKGKKDKYEALESFNFRFRENKKRSTSKYYYYETKDLHLKSDQYRVNILIENENYTRDFYVEPLLSEEKFVFPAKPELINLTHSAPKALPLRVKFRIYDINNGYYIKGVDVFVSYRGSWIKWGDFYKKYKSSLKSGRNYYFLFKKKNYYSKVVKVSSNVYQTFLNLSVQLIPSPGTLSLISNKKGMKVLLDNSEYYYTGGKNREYLELEPTDLKRQRLTLSPGRYLLTVKYSNNITASQRVYINPKKTTGVGIDFDKKEKAIRFKVY